jgi:signal transduction histidine kinase
MNPIMTTPAITFFARLPFQHRAVVMTLAWWALVCSRVCVSAAPKTNSGISVYSVWIDGRERKIPTQNQLLSQMPSQPAPLDKVGVERLQVPSSAQRTEFRFGPTAAASNSPVRLRYRLEGFDKEWREAGGEMRLNVRFLDAADSTVSAEDFSVKGESAGWAGTVARSRFDRRREVLRVPERAMRLQLELFSGGSEQTMGIMVIDDLDVSINAGTDEKPERVLFHSPLIETKDASQPLSTPPGWIRDGSKPSIARLLSSDDDQASLVLAVVDTDPVTWGAWRTAQNASVAVQPRDTLTLRWKEMYSIGWGGAAGCDYSYLPPGEYQFRVQSLSEAGEWTGAMVSLPITVVPPFWRTTWFRSVVLLIIVAALVAGVRNATRRKMKVQLEKLDRERALELERTRIARDIHDDLGSNLTQIALLSELAQTDLGDPVQARSHLKEIFTTARAVARQLDEIVWAITPANDTLEQFVSYLCKYAQDGLRVAGIRCRLDIPESLPDYSMSSAERHDLFLAAKEALHNVIKHAHADQVWLRLKVQSDALVLTIEDNGKGFGEGTVGVTNGHGLANMQNRLRHVGGTFAQKSDVGLGTSVRLQLPLTRR